MLSLLHFIFFFFNDTATTEIYTLSLHDALPISSVKFRPAKSSIGPVSFVIRVGRMALGGVGTGAGGALCARVRTGIAHTNNRPAPAASCFAIRFIFMAPLSCAKHVG